MAVTPRGIRCNNPGNIRHNKSNKWQGAATKQGDSEFVMFEAPIWGIRAIARLLIRYYDDYDCNTVFALISRWAPPNENNTRKYAETVAKRLGVSVHMPINVQKYETLGSLVRSIILVENGQQPYSDAQINEALKLAGVVPTAKSGAMAEIKNPQNIVAAVTTTAAGVSAIVAPIASVWDTLSGFIDPRILMWGVSLMLALVAAYLIIDRLKAKKEGRA